jgi:tetratricopeptide (TPR) repeat protein
MKRTAIGFCLCASLAALAQAPPDPAKAEATAAALFDAGGKGLAAEKLEEVCKHAACDLATQVRMAEDERAIGRVEAAEQLWEKRSWKEAAAAFRVVERDKAVPRIVTAARLTQLQRRAGRAKRRAFLAPILAWTTPRVLLLLDVIVPLGLLVLLVRIIREVNRRKRKARDPDRLNVRILDAMKPGWPTDDALAAKVIAELRALAMPQRAQQSIESAGESGDVAAITLPDLPDALASVGRLLDDNSALTVGIVRVPLRRIWDALAEWLDPATAQWTGTVAKDQDATLVMLARNGQDPWRARVAGTDEAATWTAVRLIASRICIETAGAGSPTRMPEALVKFFTALALADQDPPKLDDARAALISALRCDPLFWQARLRLVEVTRRLGELDLSGELLQQVKAEGKADALTVQYQEALISSKAAGYGQLRKALRLLASLVADLRTSKEADRRLELSAISVRAVVCAALLSQIVDDDPIAISQGATEVASLEESLSADSDFFERPCPDRADLVFFRLAGALALTARGAWLNKRRDGKSARASLLAAVSRRADYVPALVGLAAAYRLTKSKDHDWYEESRPWRDRALALDPLDPEAIYEQGRALEAREPPAIADAAIAYAKISDRHAGARFHQGQLLLETDAAGGLRMMVEAMRMSRIKQSHWASVALQALLKLPAAAPDLLRQGLAKVFISYLELFEEGPPDEKQESKTKREAALHEVQHDLAKALQVIARAVADVPPPEGAATAGQVGLAISAKAIAPDERLAQATAALAAALHAATAAGT